MTRKKTSRDGDRQLAELIATSAQQIWLAGLGAFSTAEKEGSKFFESLIKVGEKLQSHTRQSVKAPLQTAGSAVAGVREGANHTRDWLEGVIESRVAKTLNAMQIPTRGDVQELATRVEELRRAVAALDATAPAAPKKRKRKAATRKTAARKTSPRASNKKKVKAAAGKARR